LRQQQKKEKIFAITHMCRDFMVSRVFNMQVYKLPVAY
jgi:hypothetical protein